MSLDRRSFLKTSALATAASVVAPLITLEAEAATRPPLKPFPKSLMVDLWRDLPILLPLIYNGKATKNQVIHLADLYAYLGQQMKSCGWDYYITEAFANMDLAHAKAHIPAFTDMMWAHQKTFFPNDKKITKAFLGELAVALYHTVYDKKTKVATKGAKYPVYHPSVQKAAPSTTHINTANAISSLTNYMKFPNSSTPAGIIIPPTPNYLFVSGCEVLGFGSDAIGAVGFMSLFIPFMQPAAPVLGGIATGGWLLWLDLCT